MPNDDDNNNDPLPMVVTPAHSSDDHPLHCRQQEHATSPLLLDLWQGRKATLWRSTPDPQPAIPYQDFIDASSSPCSHEQQQRRLSSPPPIVRVVAMIQDIVGEVEYLRRQDDGTYFERQAVVVVTDYDDANVASPEPTRAAKRARRTRAATTTTTTLGMYVYWPHNGSHTSASNTSTCNNLPYNGLQLHQIIEWIAVRDPLEDHDDDGHAADDFLRPHRSTSWDTMNNDNDDYNFLNPAWGWSMDSSSPETRRHLPQKLLYWHAVSATPRTMDGLWLERQCASLVSSSLLFDQGPPAAILFVAEHLNVSTTVATALWLTLLARAEPSPQRATNPADEEGATMTMPPPATLIGCTSLTFTLPSSIIPAWKHALQRLLQPALPLVVNATNTMPPPQVVQHRHTGRVERQPWQFPPGTAIVWDQSANDASSSSSTSLLLQHSFQIPLHCIGGHVCWLPADWRLLVLQPSSRLDHRTTTATCPANTNSISLEGWTPTTATTTMPIPEHRHLHWARTLATLRESIPTVALDPTLTANVSRHVAAHRSSSTKTTGGAAVTSNTWARWWTWTRLWARAHGRATAVQADWDQAVALDAALGWS